MFCLVDWTDLEMGIVFGPGGIDELINLKVNAFETHGTLIMIFVE